MPIALGDAEPDLIRVIEPVAELSRIRRLLTTQELRRTPRVAAFFDFIVGEIPAADHHGLTRWLAPVHMKPLSVPAAAKPMT